MAAPHQKLGEVMLFDFWLPCCPRKREDSCPMLTNILARMRCFCLQSQGQDRRKNEVAGYGMSLIIAALRAAVTLYA